MDTGKSGHIYIPYQKSIVLSDLARAATDVYGDKATRQKLCGTRVGEKLHELLFTEGERVTSYLSSNCSLNSERLSVEEIKAWLTE